MADAKKSAAPRFTPREKDLLIDLVDKHKHILECKKSDVYSAAHKNETWKKVADMYNAVHGVYPRDAKQLKKGWGNIKQKWKEEKGEERRGRFKTEEHQADQADQDEHGHPTGDDLAVPFSGGTEVDEDAPTGADAAVLPSQGATAPSEDCIRPPRGRMALLHSTWAPKMTSVLP
ncbi:hypothetical protein HPB48_009327 [Haemaphysalis longicornis]|uniref:Myb/SANT-like DNA-binding domain-containing protein 3 n=1 Tax=Haemaphysalis longicornis TaxID=44386 RepID=A0A9J6GCL3_HAELO|nr:hypothetical protein HPB48_009327 [Haemaphysalis longicornis]